MASDDLLGYGAVLVAIVMFGSNFVPAKKFDTGDGMFFQWVMCSGIWSLGLIVNLATSNPRFHPLAMLGGWFWATGNIATVPIIRMIGLGLGLLLWGNSNLIMGWASSRFGLFGLDSHPPDIVWLNYLGVITCVISTLCYLGIKAEGSKVESVEVDANVNASEEEGLFKDPTAATDPNSNAIHSRDFIDNITPLNKRLIGCFLAIMAGIFYGVSFNPAQYIMDNQSDDDNGLHYVFAHFTGIYVTSTGYFLVYCMYHRNRPALRSELILPGFACGVMWAIAEISWFIANEKLSAAVSFPMITTGPGLVGSLWGMIVFGEVKGAQNFLIFGCAFALTLAGVLMVAFSAN
eukprot:TRINITY_DN5546_c0_g2_i1.p1 TRINITY_DN5546_c0_g2~~TRINITY_DN5546_c0_g2_i1.p1  ORF type:complete len:348 (-),score=55.16 TRINITY_DN5546_c0_g2_i1:63-1106(-)